MTDKKIPNPYVILNKVKELLEEKKIECKVKIGFVDGDLISGLMEDMIVISPVGDYLESQGLSPASQVDNPEFSYNIHLLLKSDAGDKAINKFFDMREEIIKILYSQELVSLGTKIMSQSIRTTFNNQISESVMYDIWIATFEVTAKIRK